MVWEVSTIFGKFVFCYLFYLGQGVIIINNKSIRIACREDFNLITSHDLSINFTNSFFLKFKYRTKLV